MSSSISSMLRMLRKSLDFVNGVYKPSINRHKGKLIEILKEKSEITSQSAVAQKLRGLKGFYTLEMAPPRTAQDFKQLRTDLRVLREFFQKGCYKHMTVKQAWLLFLVCLEVSLWFYLGETIGKWHIVGYKV